MLGPFGNAKLQPSWSKSRDLTSSLCTSISRGQAGFPFMWADPSLQKVKIASDGSSDSHFTMFARDQGSKSGGQLGASPTADSERTRRSCGHRRRACPKCYQLVDIVNRVAGIQPLNAQSTLTVY